MLISKTVFLFGYTAFDGESEYIERFDQRTTGGCGCRQYECSRYFRASVINQKPYVNGGLIENSPSVSVVAHHQEQRSRISHFNQLV